MYLTPFFSFSFILILCNPLFFKEIIPPLLIVQAFYNQEWEVRRPLTRTKYPRINFVDKKTMNQEVEDKQLS